MKREDKIAKAVRIHHGGFESATEAEIMRLWHSLDAERQTAYLKEITDDNTRPANDV